MKGWLSAAAALLAGAAVGDDPARSPGGSDSAGYRIDTWPPGAYAGPSARGPAQDSAGPADRLAAYADVLATGFGGWDDSLGMYVGTRLGDFPQVLRAAFPKDLPRQATFFPGRMDGFYLNPEPSQRNMLYTEDRGGDENFRLRLYDFTSGGSSAVPCPPGRVTGLLWSDSGRSFVYAHNPEGGDRWDIRLGLIPGRDTLLFSRPGTWEPMDLSPDGKRLLVQKYVSASESELHVFSRADGKLTRLMPGEPTQYLDHALWARLPGDSGAASVVFTSDRGGQFHRLYALHPGRPAPEPLSPVSPWDVEWVSASRDRRILVYSLNEEGLSRLRALLPGRTKPLALKGIPDGTIDGVHFRPSGLEARPAGGEPGLEFAFTLGSPLFPGDVFSYGLDTRKLVRWTVGGTAGLSASAFRKPRLVHFAGVPAWLYLPAQGRAPKGRKKQRFPVLVQIHGGPEQQARPGFDPFIQYLLSRGVAVLQPNVRGSTGYGRDYQKADDGMLRMGSVRDLGAVLDGIAARKDLDAGRVAVAGRSYGGFMSLSALIEYGDRLRAGISSVGITHFPTFLRQTSGYRRDLRRAEYGDERDPRMAAYLDSISPMTRLDRLRRPLLLSHGRNDPRVPYPESERIFAALRTRRIPVWFLTFQEEGHAVRGRASQLLQYRVMADFLALHLLPGS